MNSKILQLMLISLALTVSFATKAAANINNSILKDNNNTEKTVKNTDANIYGHVKDSKTGEHLPYVIIHVQGTTIATTTDKTGHYYLKNLPEGTFVIEAKYMGYTTESKSVTIKRDKSLELNFTLTSVDLSLDEVVVSANRNETKRRLAPNLVNVI